MVGVIGFTDPKRGIGMKITRKERGESGKGQWLC